MDHHMHRNTRSALVQTPFRAGDSDDYDHVALMPMPSTPTDTAMDHDDVSNGKPT